MKFHWSEFVEIAVPAAMSVQRPATFTGVLLDLADGCDGTKPPLAEVIIGACEHVSTPAVSLVGSDMSDINT